MFQMQKNEPRGSFRKTMEPNTSSFSQIPKEPHMPLELHSLSRKRIDFEGPSLQVVGTYLDFPYLQRLTACKNSPSFVKVLERVVPPITYIVLKLWVWEQPYFLGHISMWIDTYILHFILHPVIHIPFYKSANLSARAEPLTASVFATAWKTVQTCSVTRVFN